MATLANVTSAAKGYRVEAAQWSGTVTATAEAVDTIAVKKGWQILDVIVTYQGTGSATVTVGDAGSATRFLSSTSTAADGVSHANVPAGIGYTYAADGVIQITIGGAAVSGKNYSVEILFIRTF